MNYILEKLGEDGIICYEMEGTADEVFEILAEMDVIEKRSVFVYETSDGRTPVRLSDLQEIGS